MSAEERFLRTFIRVFADGQLDSESGKGTLKRKAAALGADLEGLLEVASERKKDYETFLEQLNTVANPNNPSDNELQILKDLKDDLDLSQDEVNVLLATLTRREVAAASQSAPLPGPASQPVSAENWKTYVIDIVRGLDDLKGPVANLLRVVAKQVDPDQQFRNAVALFSVLAVLMGAVMVLAWFNKISGDNFMLLVGMLFGILASYVKVSGPPKSGSN